MVQDEDIVDVLLCVLVDWVLVVSVDRELAEIVFVTLDVEQLLVSVCVLVLLDRLDWLDVVDDESDDVDELTDVVVADCVLVLELTVDVDDELTVLVLLHTVDELADVALEQVEDDDSSTIDVIRTRLSTADQTSGPAASRVWKLIITGSISTPATRSKSRHWHSKLSGSDMLI